MKAPPVRFTVRRMMAAVAVVALVLGVGMLGEFEASSLFGVCYFVVPPTLVIMFLRSFVPGRSHR